jgi:hypothetical protein
MAHLAGEKSRRGPAKKDPIVHYVMEIILTEGMAKHYEKMDEIGRLKKSNINTVRYEIVCPICGVFNIWEGVYSASNKESSKTDFTKVVERFFKE